jgi:hypothetical protein
MADAFTNLLGLYYPTSNGDLLDQVNLEDSAIAIDNYFAKFLTYALPRGGFLLSTDYNVTAGTGAEILVSTGAVFNLTADGPELNINAAPVSLTPSNSGMVTSGGGGTTNYLWANGGGTFTINQTGTAPNSSSQLAAVFNATTTPSITGINNFPTGRINLDQRLTSVNQTWDPPSLANAASTNTTFTLTGARLGDQVTASPQTALAAGMLIFAQVSAADTIRLTLVNLSGGTVDVASTVFTVFVRKF